MRQLAGASGLGAILHADALPIPASVRAWHEHESRDPVMAVLAGGDDYELLFAAPAAWARRLEAARRRAGKPRVTRIGRLVAGSSCVVEQDGHEVDLPPGYTHFGGET